MSTKEELVKSAFTLFATQGYDATSMSDIISAAKSTKGALYHHFTSKEDLFLAVLDMAHDKLDITGGFDFSKATKPTYKKKLLKLGYTLIDLQQSNPLAAALGFEKLLQMRKSESFRKLLCKKKEEEWMPHLIGMVEKGIEYGYFPKRSDKSVLIAKILLPLHAIGMHIMLDDKTFNFKKVWASMVEDLLHG